MSAGHTPGPWKIVPYGDGDSLVICEQDDTWRICFMATPGDSPSAWQTIKANARLIAAAPDLLRALERLLEECAPESKSATYMKARELASVALNKALGHD